MRPTFDRRLWILLFIILIQCTFLTNQQNINKPAQQSSKNHYYEDQYSAQQRVRTHPAEESLEKWRQKQSQPQQIYSREENKHLGLRKDESQLTIDDSDASKFSATIERQNQQQQQQNKCAKNCFKTATKTKATNLENSHKEKLLSTLNSAHEPHPFAYKIHTNSKLISTAANVANAALTLQTSSSSKSTNDAPFKDAFNKKSPSKIQNPAKGKIQTHHEHKKMHVAHRNQHKEVQPHWSETHAHTANAKVKPAAAAHQPSLNSKERTRRAAEHETITDAAIQPAAVGGGVLLIVNEEDLKNSATLRKALEAAKDLRFITPSVEPSEQHLAAATTYFNETLSTDIAGVQAPTVGTKSKRSHGDSLQSNGRGNSRESVIIIDDVEEFDSGTNHHTRRSSLGEISTPSDKSEDYSHEDAPSEPRVLPLRPVLPNPYEDEEMSVVYAEQHSEIRLMCEVDLDIAASMWYKNGQVVHAMDRTSRATDYRFIKEANGALTITNVMLEDDGKWQCEAENTRRYTENARPVKLVVLDRPKPPYLLIDSRRLDAGNIFVPVKENSELNLACVSEGGNPKPTLTWEVLLSPGGDRHAQKVSAEVLEIEEIRNNGAKSEARLPAVYRAHHNARILCVMEHPTLKIRQNASLLLDVQYTPSFAISRTPGFGYPLREGIEVSLKCDVDSNPPSTPRWQKDDGETPVPQTGDGFLNFTSIRREHSGWYKCTSRHLNFQYSSIGYYLSVRYDSVDVTSEPDDQDVSVAAASHNPNKGQLEVQLGGAVTLQCPQGSLGCWSHLDPVTARLRGLGHGLTTPTGQFSLKDVVYHDAGVYKCIGQSAANKKKLEVLQTVGLSVKGAPTAIPRNSTPVAYPGSPLHLTVEFCANPPAHAARWLHGDRVYTPGNQYGSTVLAYGVTDLPTPYCKEARLTYVSMHERVPRTFYFIVSSPGGVAEAVFKVNFTMRYRVMSNNVDDEEEELSEPEEIHFPVFGSQTKLKANLHYTTWLALISCIWTRRLWYYRRRLC